MSEQFVIEAINISTGKGTIKKPVEEVQITETGIQGDAHGGYWHRQISLLAAEDVEAFAETIDRTFAWGEFAENLTTRGIDLSRVAVLDHIIAGDVDLEITQIGKACHHGCDIYKEVGACIMPKQGLFARVISPGIMTAGMTATWKPRPMRVAVITLSDRAFTGVYEDRSGPAISESLTQHIHNRRDHLELQTHLINDSSDKLLQLYEQLVSMDVDLIITTGGTGLGPRDIVPEVTESYLDKTLPGLMDHIRIKFGSKKTGALLSRGFAGTKNRTFIINMPGSVRAVTEYTAELLTVWDHIRRMIHSIDQH